MELAGQNWLIPSDAVLKDSNDVPNETVPLNWVLSRMRGMTKLLLVILDVVTAGNPMSTKRGLAPVELESGEVLFYAVQDNFGRSPFTEAILEHISEEGIELELFFSKVASTVLRTTSSTLEPLVCGVMPSDFFYFKPPK